MTLSATAQVDGSAPFSTAGTTAEAVTDFLSRLQKAVQADDRKAVATLTTFPLKAWNGKQTVALQSRGDLLAQYPAIFSDDLQKLIAAAQVKDTFANWQGVMLGNGRIWFRRGANGALHIATINPP